MSFWHEYLLFFSKLVTFGFIAIAIIVIIVMAVGALMHRSKTREKVGKLTIRSLNEHYKEFVHGIQAAIVRSKVAKKQYKKEHKASLKQQTKQLERSDSKPRLFVINFHGDIRASGITSLREEITAILLAANPKVDQVLLRLESGGGMVHAYGLASSQLQRLKQAGILLTVAIDKVAASGGYMMACVADKIIAAPFAVIGSIGVIAQLPNFHRYLEEKNIDFEQIMAGKYKRTLTMFGENTEEGRQKMQAEVEDTHDLFKEFVAAHRPEIDIEQVATGEHWFAIRAHAMKLVDQLQTSDDYLLANREQFALYELEYHIKRTLAQRLGLMSMYVVDKVWGMSSRHSKYFCS